MRHFTEVLAASLVRHPVPRPSPPIPQPLPTHRPLPCTLVVAAALAAVAIAGGARAEEGTQGAPAAPAVPTAAADTPLELKLAPEIGAPPVRAPAPKPGAPPATRLTLPGNPTASVTRGGATPSGARLTPGTGSDEDAIFLRADRVQTFGRTRVEASGNVELRTRTETVLAEQLLYEPDSQTITATGDVLLRQGNDWVTGPELVFRRDTQTGHFVQPSFFISESGGRGDAERIEFLGPDLFQVDDGRYTTCVAPRNDWFVQSRELTLDRMRNVGEARDARVLFYDTPVFYFPYLTFPLSNERKSGFLTPTAGSTGARGFELSTPYYLNLAPNYDATLTPRLMTRRGMQFGAQFRYLFNEPQPMLGEFDGEYLPNDRVADRDRYALSFRHSQQLAPWMSGYLNLNKVSDDKYFADLADRIAITSQSTLPREGGVNAMIGPVAVTARAQSFQTLQDPTQPIAPPYNMLPQVAASWGTQWKDLSFGVSSEYTQFRNAELPEGNRGVLFGSASYSVDGPWWFFTARGAMHSRWYDLMAPGDAGTHPSVYVPMSSLDAGIVLERDWSAFGHDFVHTLEPRLFYVYIPYRTQNALPVFDSAIDDFNFSQLFTENRYLGNDRIGDANQLTAAVSSRLLDPRTGAERLRVAVGQRFYFADQRVTLSEQPRSSSSSDVLLQVDGRLSDAWALQGLMQQNLDSGTNERLNLGVRYTPEPGSVLSASYRYTRQLVDPTGQSETIKQVDLAAEWPLDLNWTVLGRWNYSIEDRKTLEAIAGFEYNKDCWILRVVFHRLATTTEQTNNSVFVQLEFNGLARVGTSPLDLLRRSVPGYLRSNDPSRFRRDTRLDPMPEF